MSLRRLRALAASWTLRALPLVALGAAGSAHAGYVFTEVSRPGAAVTALWDINNLGVMVGYSVPGSGPTDFASAFIYDGSSFTALSGPAGAISSSALGISDAGVVVGTYSSSTTVDSSGNVVLGPSSGFILSGGVYTTFDVAGANDTVLRGISPDGRYLSGYYTTASVQGVGFVYDTLTSALTLVSEPDSQFTIAQGINTSGILVGGDIIAGASPSRPGFFYDTATGTRTNVSIAGASRTAQRSIDENGVVAGWFLDAGSAQHGFVGAVASYLQIDLPGADGTYVEGSNNARTLVGGFIAGTTQGAFVARLAVPEPSPAALLAGALFMLACSRRLQVGGCTSKATSTRDTML